MHPFRNTTEGGIVELLKAARLYEGEGFRLRYRELPQQHHAFITGGDVLDFPLPVELSLRRGIRRFHGHTPSPFQHLLLWHIRLLFAYTLAMRIIGHSKGPDWPKLGPSILIATALIVAIRTAKWAAKRSGDAHLSDVDTKLDVEVSYAACISIRVMHELLRKHEGLFPQKTEPVYAASGPEEDIQR